MMKHQEMLNMADEQTKLFNAVPDYAPYGYNDWQDKRDGLQRLFPDTDRWLMRCYNMPRQTEIIMAMYNEVLEGHGVEAIRIEGEHIDNFYFDIIASYVNMGDTYDTTVIYDHANDEFIVTSWGDFVEALEMERESD